MPLETKRDLEQPLSNHNLTPDAVGKLATAAGVKALVITHFAGGTPDPKRTNGYIAQIAKRYAGPVKLANDLDQF